MLKRILTAAAMTTAALMVQPAFSNRVEEFSTTLSGFNEVGGLGAGETGAVMSEGTGHLKLVLDRSTQSIRYTLTFSGLSSPVLQSHIHFGKVHVAGGVMVFFCSNLATAPAGVQPCPAGGGTVTGTIMANNVLALPGQGVTAGDFDAITDALESETAYANVHTQNFPAGEIRGDIARDGRDGRDHDRY